MRKKLTILGSTGSVGLSTISVVNQNMPRFEVFALTGNTQIDLLADQCIASKPSFAVVTSEKAASKLRSLLADKNLETEVLVGDEGLNYVSSAPEVDIVMSAIVGAQGLLPTFSAVCAGKVVLLANKESLVMAGKIIIEMAEKYNSTLLPVDSEHNAIFQCLSLDEISDENQEVTKLTLTASGGPFLEYSQESLCSVTPEEACAHPIWNMGKKISIDSATLMNKGLELIEARWFFDCSLEKLDVIIHPQSIIHSFVHYLDGSVIAQFGVPDMRIPISYCLGWPKRIFSGAKNIALKDLSNMQFFEPDREKFKALKLSEHCIENEMDTSIYLNASNEVAVDAFLSSQITFPEITDIVEEVLSRANFDEPLSIDDVKATDFRARQMALEIIRKWKSS